MFFHVSVCMQDNSKRYEWFLMKFFEVMISMEIWITETPLYSPGGGTFFSGSVRTPVASALVTVML